MPNKLLKADIIGGRFAKVSDFYVEEWDGTVSLWSLTDGQLSHVEALRVRGLDMNVDSSTAASLGNEELSSEERVKRMFASGAGMRLDIETMTFSESLADAQAVAYSLSGGGEVWTVAEVQAMRPASVVKKLVAEVYRLSGVDKGTAPALAAFRADGSSDGDMLSGEHRDTVSSDASGAHPAPTPILAGGNAGLPAENAVGDPRPLDANGFPIGY